MRLNSLDISVLPFRFNFLLPALLVFTLFLVSCGGSGASVTTNEDFQVGTGSLSYRFFQNTPPTEMFSGTRENVVLILENTGAHDIEYGSINLITDPTQFSLLNGQRQSFSLEGRNKYNPSGDEKQVSFLIEAKDLPLQSARQDVELFANVCYDYVTEYNDIVCVDTDPYDEVYTADIQKICNVRDLSSSGQGAPIAVTHVAVSMHKDTTGVVYPTFILTIENRGSGTVVAHNQVQELCSGNALSDDTLNRVSLYASLGDQPLYCDLPVVTLTKKKTTVRCVDEFGIDSGFGTYETPFYVKLSYGYSDTITKRFSLVRYQ